MTNLDNFNLLTNTTNGNDLIHACQERDLQAHDRAFKKKNSNYHSEIVKNILIKFCYDIP